MYFTKNEKPCKYHGTSIIIIFITFLISNKILSQGPPVEWRNYSWINHEYNSNVYVDQRHSDYDWWYDHCTGYTNPITKTGHIGYIAAGVGKYRCAERSNAGAQPLTYNEQDPAYGSWADGCTYAQAPLFKSSCDYDYGNFENHVSGALGLGFNQIGKINPDGTTGFVITMNYDGEYMRVKQLQDGTFLTVGSTVATRKRLDPPQSGKPLYYNKTATNPSDYFKYNEIFDINNPQQNVQHWDVMKFDGNGTCLFDNLYGLNDFNAPGTFNYTIDGNPYSHTGKQLAYFLGGQASDFIQEPGGNIAIVGGFGDYQDNGIGKATIMKIDVTGKILAKRFVTSIMGKGSVARAVEFATIGGVDYYIIAVTQENIVGTGNSQVDIYALPTSLSGAPALLHSFIPTDPVNKCATVWGLTVVNNQLYIPLITNSNWVWWSGDRFGDLNIVKLNLNDFNPSTNVLANNFLTQIHAFDLKARITSLSDGNFALVGAVQNASWSSLGCSTPPSYIMNNSSASDASCGWKGQSTDWWNTDTYVAKVDVNAIKLWDKSFDSDTPFSCGDYPTSPSSGGGDPKRQECMYGVSEAPDGGIVVSGNNSSNADDNYMAKLYSDCNLQQTYDINGLVNINSSVTWNSSHMVKGIIKINSGGILNITGTGTTIQFADSKLTGIDTRIEIYPGGKLNINGATLTSVSSCPNSMWDGIKLIGNGDDAPQTTAYQPNINLSSATIKNARLGIENGIINGPAYSSGGWIIATNSTFLNNYIDVSFLDYKAPIVNGNEQNNKSIFTGCTFKSDNYLNDPSYVSQIPGVGIKVRLINFVHVSLSGVKGVRFIGNTFKADLTAIGGVNYTTNFRGVGIKSSNSIFDVFSTCLAQDINGNCTSYGPSNVFENLLYGVFAGSTDPLKKFSVVKANFTNCNSSIYQSGINYSTVNKNNFVVNTTIPQVFGKFNCSTHPEACMTHFYYLNNSSGFSHQENNYSVTSSQKVMGTVFNACGTGANESYRNTYAGCHVGHQAQLTNGSSGTGMNGLQIKCNQNTTTKLYDITQTSGVVGEQGFCNGIDLTTPANNTFSHFQPSPPSDINAYTGGGFKYNFNPNPFGGVQEPTYRTANITSGSCLGLGNFVYNTTTCPSKLNPPGSSNPPQITKLQTDAQNFRQTAEQLTAELNQKLADGASITLINAINSTMDNGNLKNLLLSKSPYLSDDVLITYLQRPQTPPTGHIQEVIVANSPVSSNVKSVLDNMNLPNGIRNQINSSQAGTSIITQNKQEIAYNVFNKDLTVNEIVRYYLDDTVTSNTYDYIIKWLEWNEAIEYKYDLVFAHTEKENYMRAQSLIDSLNTLTSNAPHIEFLQSHKTLKENHKNWRELETDVVLKNKVEVLSSDSLSPLMGNARAALSVVFANTKNYELIEGFNSSNNSSRLSSHQDNTNSPSIYNENLLSLNAYPNPFGNQLNVIYDIKKVNQEEGQVEIKLFEISSGRLIIQQKSNNLTDNISLPISDLSNGVYMISLTNNNVNIGNIKVIKIQ